MENSLMQFIVYSFANPLWYLFLLYSFYQSYQRVVRERKDFRVRFHSVLRGTLDPLISGVLLGGGVSLVLLGAGAAVTKEMLILIAAVFILLLLTFRLRVLNPVFAIGIAGLGAYFYPRFVSEPQYLVVFFKACAETPLSSLLFLLAALLAVEGILYFFLASKITTPRRLISKRGKVIGAHTARRVWILPALLLVPAPGPLLRVGEWPFAAWGDSFSVVLFPFAIGLSKLIIGMKPEHAVKKAGVDALFLFLLALAGALISRWTGLELVAAGTLFFLLVLRTVHIIIERLRQKKMPPYFRPESTGLMVLGVLPGSPADKMGIQPGEVVVSVNGEKVFHPEQFYVALQKRPAYCRLEVRGEDGETRFTGSPVYEGEHHQLGLLFVDVLQKEVR